MQLGRKKTLMDRAHDVVDQVADTVSETVIPQLEAALEQTREKAGPALADARDRAKPVLAEGRALAAEKATEARERAVPLIAEGRALAAEKAAVGASIAAEKAAAGRDLAAAKVAEVRGEPEPKHGRLKKFLLVTGLLAIGGLVFSKLRGRQEEANWQSSYVPTPPPSPSPGTRSTAAPTQDSTDTVATPVPGGDPLTDPLPTSSDDTGGGEPGEAISDAVEEPQEPTTPDAPAEVIDIDDASGEKK